MAHARAFYTAQKLGVLAKNYRLTGVPAFIVNGKYMTSGHLAGSYDNIVKTLDLLIEKERAAAAPAATQQ